MESRLYRGNVFPWWCYRFSCGLGLFEGFRSFHCLPINTVIFLFILFYLITLFTHLRIGKQLCSRSVILMLFVLHSAYKILLQTEEDRLTVVVNQGLLTLSDVSLFGAYVNSSLCSSLQGIEHQQRVYICAEWWFMPCPNQHSESENSFWAMLHL